MIISNAKKGWVEFSSSLMLPKVHKVIMKYITVISARTLFEESHPDNVEKWKELTFLSLKQKEELDSVPLTNLIVIGDAEFEMAAGEELARTIGQCVFKQIKL